MYRVLQEMENLRILNMLAYLVPNFLVSQLDISMIEKLGFNGFLIISIYIMWKQFSNTIEKSKDFYREQIAEKAKRIEILENKIDNLQQLLIKKNYDKIS